MALDVGEKRVGVAVSDETGTIATPRDPILRQQLTQDLARIRTLGEQLQVQRIVVGWPLSLNGTVGPQAKRVEAFVKQLLEVVPWPVDLVDERFSSRAAERVLIEQDVRRSRRRDLVDGLAAAMILKTYLDRRRADQERGDA
ncbi:MAG: Holliday junction resolvase RuvX [Clostridia bacterium]